MRCICLSQIQLQVLLSTACSLLCDAAVNVVVNLHQQHGSTVLHVTVVT